MRWHLFILACAAVACCPGVRADVAPSEEALEAGRKALTDSGEFPWYDAEQDAIARIDVAPPKDVAGRKSRWQQSTANASWPEWLTRLLEMVSWAALGVIIVLLIWLLSRAAVSSHWVAGTPPPDRDGAVQGDVDRIEALPFQLNAATGDLLSLARQYYEAGDFSRAIIYLYSYQLIQLDRHQLIRLTKGKTNRQYLREVRGQPELWALLQRTVMLFEDVFFGRHVLDREHFETCWGRLDDFHLHLGRVAA